MAESFTNQAREQAESKSSFFKREKLLSGFRSKRSRITGAKFKKGTSQESSDNIEKRVAQNEKKITLLKNIIKLRKENVDKQLKPEDTPQQMGSPLLNSLQSIAASVDSIRDTLIQKQDNDEDIIEDMRIAGEKADADKQEKGLENTNPKLLAKLGDKVIAPVMGIFEKIFNFIKTLILGKFLMNFLDWFSNPANQKKIASFVRFIKDWWPALTAAVLLFGTGFASLAAGLVKIVAGFTVKLIALIPKLMAALAKLRMGKLLKMIPGGKGKAGLLLKGATLIGGGVLLEKTISGDFSGKDEEEPQEFNKGGQVPGSGNKDTVPAMLTPGEFVMSKGAVQKYGTDTLAGMNAAAGGTNRPTLMGRYNEGGVVTDPKERQQQEAYMLKYVNEERAMQGMEPLNNLTYAPGVELTKMRGPGPRTKETSDTFTDLDRGIETTSTSKTVDGKTTFGASMRQTTEEDRQKFFAENPHAAQLVNLRDQAELDSLGADISASARMNGGGLVQGFQGGGLVQSQIDQYKRLKMERSHIQRDPDGKIRGADRKKYNQLSKEMNKLSKQIQASQKSTPTPTVTPKKSGGSSGILGLISSNVDEMVNRDKYKVGSKEPKKSGGSSGILGPISSNVDEMVNRDKYKVGSKEPKNTVVAYEQEANKNQQKTAPASGGNEIPSFDVAPIRDPLKMVTLQIVLF